MKRSRAGRSVGLIAWSLASAMVGGVLVILFTFTDPVSLAGEWPLGIQRQEVDFAAAWGDRRMGDTAVVQPERYLIGSPANECLFDASGPGWSKHWFEADGHGDSVQVRKLRAQASGFVIKFSREEPFRTQRHIVLVPATVESIRAKYLELLAGELGLVTPEVSFVRLIACGLDRGIYMKEERIDVDFLEKQGLAGSSLFTQGHDPARPDHLFPAFEDDTLAGPMLRRTLQLAYTDQERGASGALPYIVDAKAGVGLLLMQWLEHGSNVFAGEDLFAYNWSKGRIVPLYRHARGELALIGDGPVALDFFTALPKDPAVRAALSERLVQLAEERWRLKERFAAMDRVWLPILVQGRSLARAQAIALRIQDDLIGARLDHNDALADLDRKLVRHAGSASFNDTTVTSRYWPAADDARILDRIAERTKAHVAGDTLIFPRGVYKIMDDLTVPYGYSVVLEPGARFEIAAGRSVIVQGHFFVRGTARNPVFVRPMDDAQPFGTFAVVGDGGTRCSIVGLQLGGGSEARVNGVYYSGMLAIHNAAATVMVDCVISDSRGEDLLNIKDGLVELRDCVFEDGQADLVDLDRCKGSVTHCVFRSGRNDSNGDGLDVSGARILVTGCTFKNMMDKGISVGEASQLMVRGSRFEGNRLAIAAKDLSIAYVEGNTFIENKIVFGAYRKKPIYGGARVMRYANEYVGNIKEQEVDELSAIVPQEKLDEKVLKTFGAQ